MKVLIGNWEVQAQFFSWERGHIPIILALGRHSGVILALRRHNSVILVLKRYGSVILASGGMVV